jgi:hypothetical protein
MNAITDVKASQWVLNNDGITYRCQGQLQRPLDKEMQQRLGLVATTSRSISGREVKTGAPRA